MVRTLPFLLLLLTLALSGCARPVLITTVPVEDVPRIEPGSSIDAVRTALEGRTYWAYRKERGGGERERLRALTELPLKHLFTVQRGTDTVIVATAEIIGPRIAFIFFGDRLERMLAVPEAVSTYGPEDLEALLARKPLTADELIDYVKTTTERKERFLQRVLEPPPIPAFLGGPSADEWALARRRAELQATYDPFAVRLGMSSEDVAEVLGEPVATYVDQRTQLVRSYGEAVSAERNDTYIAVWFEEGRAIKVLSGWREVAGAGPIAAFPATPDPAEEARWEAARERALGLTEEEIGRLTLPEARDTLTTLITLWHRARMLGREEDATRLQALQFAVRRRMRILVMMERAGDQ